MTRTSLLGGIAALLLVTGAAAQSPDATPPAAAGAPAAQAAPTPAQAARPVPPRSFPSPEAGFAALVGAIDAQDRRQVLRIFGSAGQRLLRARDPAAMREARERFLAAHAAKSEILRPEPDLAILAVGEDGWTMPIPMRRRGQGWEFDIAAGEQEILDRQIGRNELGTIDTLRGILEAQRAYAQSVGAEGESRAYARRFSSTPGQRDGLHWPAAAGEPASLIGPELAQASRGPGQPRRQQSEPPPEPWHGYFFRMLHRQGPAAPGGAASYMAQGRMTGGFAVIAWPARYGTTGIKSFLISHHGEIYERDLGPETPRAVAAIGAFDPGAGWERVAE